MFLISFILRLWPIGPFRLLGCHLSWICPLWCTLDSAHLTRNLCLKSWDRNQTFPSTFAIFCTAATEHTTQSSVAYSLRRVQCVVGLWKGPAAGGRGSWSHYIHHQETERKQCRYSAHFQRFPHFGTPLYGDGAAPFKTGSSLVSQSFLETPSARTAFPWRF